MALNLGEGDGGGAPSAVDMCPEDVPEIGIRVTFDRARATDEPSNNISGVYNDGDMRLLGKGEDLTNGP